MFKSLLRTLPSLSGNVKLVCDVSHNINTYNNNFNNNSNSEYINCYVNNASLEPISKNVYKQPININLFKSRYDYDLSQFYTLYSDIFYKSCYSYSKVDAKKIDKSHEANERDKDFEFGCSRISYKDKNKQFSFFAPIYIDNVFDIPDAFIIECNIRYGEYNIKKKLKINIASDIDLTDSKTNIIYNSKNLLFNYIYNYVFNIDNKVIYIDYVDPNNSNNNNVYYYGIDLMRGGFTKSQDITVNKIFSDQQTINNFDNIICSGFKNTKTCMKQILPLCFNFNVSDLFTEWDASRLYLSDITFSGYYINKNNKIEELFDFDIDYSKFALNILDINNRTGEIMSAPGIIDNMMDYSFPSLHDKYFYKYQFMNKISPNTTRWIMAASNCDNVNENYNYIINNNIVFSLNQDSQYKYRYFPVNINSGNNVGCCNKISLDTNNKVNDYNYISNNTNNIYLTSRNRTILYNMLLPVDKKVSININNFQSEIYNSVNRLFSTIYKDDKKSNCYDFFNIIYHDNKIYEILNQNTGEITNKTDYINYINPKNNYKLLQSTSDENISIFDKSGTKYDELWKSPVNDYVYYNDVLYNLNNLYINNNVAELNERYNKFLSNDTEVTDSLFEIAKHNKNAHFIDNTNYDNYLSLQKITKFGVFAMPFFNVINNKQIKKIYNIDNLYTFISETNSSPIYDNIIVSSNILDNDKLNIFNANDTIKSNKLNLNIDVNNNLYIDETTSDMWKKIFSPEHLSYTTISYSYTDVTGENVNVSYNIYKMSNEWIDTYSKSYNYLYCDYDELYNSLINKSDDYAYSNMYVEVENLKTIFEQGTGQLAIGSYVPMLLNGSADFVNAYELLPLYNIKSVAYKCSYNVLSYVDGFDFTNNDKNTYLYYKLQNNDIMTDESSVLIYNNTESISTSYTQNTNDENLSPLYNSYLVTNYNDDINTNNDRRCLMLTNSNSLYDISNYGLFDYTLYNKKTFIEITSYEKLTYVKNIIDDIKSINNNSSNNKVDELDIYAFKPYIKYNGNTVVKNVMMKKQLETEFDGNMIRHEDDINYLWTDIYNLNNLFDRYNNEDKNADNLVKPYDDSRTREFWFDFINKEHLKKYLEYVSADENNMHKDKNGNTISINDWKYITALNDFGPFTNLYACEKVLVIDSKTKLSSVKYRYTSFVTLIRNKFIKENVKGNETNIYKYANEYLNNYTLYDLIRNITFINNSPLCNINISYEHTDKYAHKIIYNWTLKNVHLMYKKKFYPVDEDIMVKLSNLFDKDDIPVGNDNEVWCDFYFSKPLSNKEYDIMMNGEVSYPVLNIEEYNNELELLSGYEFSDSDMTNLTPVYNDVYLEERQDTKINTLININDINACKKIVGHDTEKRYRYAKPKYNNFITLNTNCLNKILDLYNKEVSNAGVDEKQSLEDWIKKKLNTINIFTRYNTDINFVTLLSPTSDVDEIKDDLKEYDYLGLSKYNIFTYYNDGEIYGFYLFAININNTSEIFDNLYGFDMETVKNKKHDSTAIRNTNYKPKISSDTVSKFDAFDNHPFFKWVQHIEKKHDSTTGSTDTDDVKIYYDYIYNIEGIKYFINNIKTIMPVTNISIMKHLYEISDVVSKPNVTNLNINYIAKKYNTANNSKEYNIIYTKKSNNDIVSLKKLKMTRYFGYIMPSMKSVDKLIYNNKFDYVFNLKCKWIDNVILDEGIYNSINDTPLDFYIESNNVKDYSTIFNIYKYAPISIFDISTDTTIKNYNNFVGNYTEPEYKHFNCSKLYNLIPKIIIDDTHKYTYKEILNVSSDTTCINKFINYITDYNNSRYKRSHTSEYDDNLTYSELLFLYNRYKCTITTNCVGVNNDDLKLYTIRYIYDLL